MHTPDKAKTEQLGSNMDQVPFEAIDAIGRIFAEGEVKYGRDNWKKGVDDLPYQRERLNHAIRHLMLYANGDLTEPHLAKVAWFCVTQLFFDSPKASTDNSCSSLPPPSDDCTSHQFDPLILYAQGLEQNIVVDLINAGAKTIKVSKIEDATEILVLNHVGRVVGKYLVKSQELYTIAHPKAPISRPAQAEPTHRS